MAIRGDKSGQLALLGLYDCLVDPAKVVTLIDALGSWLMEQPTPEDLLAFETHSKRLWELLNASIAQEITAPSKAKNVQNPPLFVSRDLRCLKGPDDTAAPVNLHLDDLMIEDQCRFKTWLNAHQSEPIALRLAERKACAQLIWLEPLEGTDPGRAPAPSPAPAPAPAPEGAVARLTLLTSGLRDVVERTFAQSFGLSEGELRVLDLLSQGHNLKEAAATLAIKYETVRTHIKRMTAKLGVASQGQALSMVSMVDRQLRAATATVQEPTQDVLEFKGGERVSYRTYGPKSGRPVLYIHGMMAGRHLPETVKPLLAAAKVRLIVPARPGVCETTQSSPCPQATLAQTVDQLALVANTFGAIPAPIITDGTGLIFALEYARAYPGRCTQVLALDPMPALRSEADLQYFQGRFQMAMAATYSSATAVQSLLQLAYLDAKKIETEADLADWHYFRTSGPDDPPEDPDYLRARFQNFCENRQPNFAHLAVDTALLKSNFTYFSEGSNLRPPVHIFQTDHSAFVTQAGTRALATELEADMDLAGSTQPYVTGQLSTILSHLM